MQAFTGKGRDGKHYYKGRVWLGDSNRVGCRNGATSVQWRPARQKRSAKGLPEPLPPHGLLEAGSDGPFIHLMLDPSTAGLRLRLAAQ